MVTSTRRRALVGVDVYAGLDNVSDDRMTQWSRREFNEDLCSVLEWENFSLCKRNLEQIKNSYEDLNSSTPEAKLGKDQSSNSLLKSDCRQSREILPAYHAIHIRSEQLREAAHLKRRFLHYFDAISLPLKVTDQVQLASVAEHFRRQETKPEAADVDNMDDEGGISEGRR
ncbi:hypothetical protein BSL78_17785 [Apostichopus japonicus]|uniref:Uncharacterized protein n=1 Tax=Stichopus japonicus TaxID=307972 RepID=A0A2G8KBH9_STIJA|nr:hypothetical protein BSL78_17785 [Apostichopus japonicus]